jgi:hypothetical protein
MSAWHHDAPTDAADAERRYVAAALSGDTEALHGIAIERNAVGDRVGSDSVAEKAAELGDGGAALRALADVVEREGDVARARRLRQKADRAKGGDN